LDYIQDNFSVLRGDETCVCCIPCDVACVK
jgi:hypothetical protein